MRAFVTLKDTPHYRRDAFMTGMEACGYRVERPASNAPRPDDVLVCWNRYGPSRNEAQRFEAAGVRVMVVENGLIGYDRHGWQLYQVAMRYHNGAGDWFVGTEDRWSRLGVKVKPWRASGRRIVVCPQRIVGNDGVGMPKAPELWAKETVAELKRYTDRPIEVRLHPGNVTPKPQPDWNDLHAVVVWGSTAGLKAIVNGVPAFYLMPRWIGAPAARFGLDRIEDPWIGDRGPMLHRLSWTQWTVDEIATGEPLARLLGLDEQKAA